MSKRLRAGEFVKYHGLGNDYLALDAEAFGARLTAARVRALCDRHRGPGADGIVARVPGPPRGGGDFAVRIYNPDGSEAEKIGNGLRIFARFLYEHGYTRRQHFSIGTRGGLVEARLLLRTGRVHRIRIDMGRADFCSHHIPVVGPRRDVVDETWKVDGQRLRISCVSIGNPHCVVFRERLDRAELLLLGPRLETDPRFPERTNVQLAKVVTRRRIRALVWERGTGETLASGSSSCAVAAAAFRLGHVDRRVTVSLPGGDLPIEIGDDFSLRLTGPAEPVYRGRLLD